MVNLYKKKKKTEMLLFKRCGAERVMAANVFSGSEAFASSRARNRGVHARPGFLCSKHSFSDADTSTRRYAYARFAAVNARLRRRRLRRRRNRRFSRYSATFDHNGAALV